MMKTNGDIIRELIGDVCNNDLIAFLNDNNYFTCPASVKHHGNETGGLFHDMCKTNDYIYVIDSPGKELFGGAVINEGGHWDYNPEPFVKGHGDKSVMMLSTVLQLTEEEMFYIRFHMGAFTDSSEWKFYTNAVHKFPNVLWTHQADMIAAHCLGV